eukprot:9498822-Pyramimonas_sp.AAC.1
MGRGAGRLRQIADANNVVFEGPQGPHQVRQSGHGRRHDQREDLLTGQGRPDRVDQYQAAGGGRLAHSSDAESLVRFRLGKPGPLRPVARRGLCDQA